jgi:hypothetical protein
MQVKAVHMKLLEGWKMNRRFGNKIMCEWNYLVILDRGGYPTACGRGDRYHVFSQGQATKTQLHQTVLLIIQQRKKFSGGSSQSKIILTGSIFQCCRSVAKKCKYKKKCWCGFLPLLNYGEPRNIIRNLEKDSPVRFSFCSWHTLIGLGLKMNHF